MSRFDDDHIAQLLNRDVDELTGPRRATPAFRPPVRRRSPQRRKVDRRWLLPLVAACAVAAVALGTFGVSHILSSHRTEPGQPLPGSGVSVDPTPTDPPRPQSLSPSRSTSSRSASSTTTNDVALAGARISLPAGWEARPKAQYLTDGSSLIYSRTWCLWPASTVGSRAACTFTLAAPTAAEVNRQALDYDVIGGTASDPAPCQTGVAGVIHHQSGNRTLGGRVAEWRHFDITCADGAALHPEQYEISTEPAFVLATATGTPAELTAIQFIAAGSTFPAATMPLRYLDRGYLRSVRTTSSGVHIEVDRTAGFSDDGTPVNTNPATYGYDVPAAVWSDARPAPRIGTVIAVNTDGVTVTRIGS